MLETTCAVCVVISNVQNQNLTTTKIDDNSRVCCRASFAEYTRRPVFDTFLHVAESGTYVVPIGGICRVSRWHAARTTGLVYNHNPASH